MESIYMDTGRETLYENRCDVSGRKNIFKVFIKSFYRPFLTKVISTQKRKTWW